MPRADDLQLSWLEGFVRLAEAGSLSAAARQLHQTPAAASAALKRLEALMQVRLVERSTRSLRLTAEGEVLLEHAREMLASLDTARSRMRPGDPALEGEIHLAAPADLARGWLLPSLAGFLERHPGITLVLHVSDTLTDLRRERIDLALRYGSLPDSDLVARPLHQSRRALVASPAYLARHGHPAHPQDLTRHNCLSLYLAGRAQIDWRFWPRTAPGAQGAQGVPSPAARGDGAEEPAAAHRAGKPLTVRVHGNRRADDGEIVRRWALEGLGIAYKSRLDVREDLRSGRLVELLPDWLGEPFPLHAVLPTGRYLPPRVRGLLDELLRQARRLDDAAQAEGAPAPAGPG